MLHINHKHLSCTLANCVAAPCDWGSCSAVVLNRIDSSQCNNRVIHSQLTTTMITWDIESKVIMNGTSLFPTVSNPLVIHTSIDIPKPFPWSLWLLDINYLSMIYFKWRGGTPTAYHHGFKMPPFMVTHRGRNVNLREQCIIILVMELIFWQHIYQHSEHEVVWKLH